MIEYLNITSYYILTDVQHAHTVRNIPMTLYTVEDVSSSHELIRNIARVYIPKVIVQRIGEPRLKQDVTMRVELHLSNGVVAYQRHVFKVHDGVVS